MVNDNAMNLLLHFSVRINRLCKIVHFYSKDKRHMNRKYYKVLLTRCLEIENSKLVLSI